MLSGRAIDKRLWWTLASVIPALIVFWVGTSFVWNHFYVEGPYLQDSGWYSAIIWRSGVLPQNPSLLPRSPLGEGIPPEYYGVHVSPIVSVVSLLSYAFPGDRVTWYCLFEGAIYAPLGAVVALLGTSARYRLRSALLIALAALMFGLSGQVWACIGYPHYEILVPVGLSMMLAGLATERVALAWVGLAIATLTREDGGIHAASFAIAVLAADLSGRPFPVRRRALIHMAVVSFAASVAMFAAQRLFFHPANLFRREYLGTPAFGHLSVAVLGHRALVFVEDAAFVLLPFVATVAIAIVRRDGRYLFGWIVELPWFALNFLAAQELKSAFTIYTGFPFVASMFWVGAYAHVAERDRPPSPMREPLAMLAAVAALSTFGLWLSNSAALRVELVASIAPSSSNGDAIRSFASTLRANPHAYGRVFVDHAMAAWTIESVRGDDVMTEPRATSPADHDGFAFFRGSLTGGDRFVDWLVRSPFDRCGQIPDTRVMFCTRRDRKLPPEFVPTSLMFDGMQMNPALARRVGAKFEVRSSPSPGIALYGPWIRLQPGSYSVLWRVTFHGCRDQGSPIHVDVAAGGKPLTELSVEAPDQQPELTFKVLPTTGPIEFRSWAASCTYVLHDIKLHAR